MNQRDAWNIISSIFNDILETINQLVVIHLEDTNHIVVDVREFPINQMKIRRPASRYNQRELPCTISGKWQGPPCSLIEYTDSNKSALLPWAQSEMGRNWASAGRSTLGISVRWRPYEHRLVPLDKTKVDRIRANIASINRNPSGTETLTVYIIITTPTLSITMEP